MAITIRAHNPAMPALALVNGGKMARRKRSGRKASTKRRSSSRRGKRRSNASVRASRNVGLRRASNPRRHKKRRSVARSHHSRRRSTRRRNPILGGLGGGNIGEAGKLVIASIGIGWVNRNFTQPLVNRFVPGQFAVPVSTVATGYGLGILAGMTSLTSPLKKPFQLMGWVLGITAFVTPFLSGILGGSSQGQMAGGRMRGIGAWPPVPGMGISAGGMLTAAPQAGKKMAGIGAWRPVGA